MKSISDHKLLQEWANAVKDRAGNKCEYPDCTVNSHQLHAHHLYSRRWVTMRYNLDAGICLCAYHHTLSGLSAHKDPDFKETLILGNVRTRDFFDNLREVRNRTQKNTSQFKQECLEKIKRG